MEETILYFVKYPEPGKVKTRLARTVGHEAAARMYRGLAETNWDVLRQSARNAIVMYDPPGAESLMKEWLTDGKHFAPQAEGGLGERLAHAFDQAFALGAKRVIAAGSDTLGFGVSHIDAAFDALQTADAVIGPAQDGGYYLIGLTSPRPEIFSGISWSTPAVYEQTVKKLSAGGIRYKIIASLKDLDEMEPGSDSVFAADGRKIN